MQKIYFPHLRMVEAIAKVLLAIETEEEKIKNVELTELDENEPSFAIGEEGFNGNPFIALSDKLVEQITTGKIQIEAISQLIRIN